MEVLNSQRVEGDEASIPRKLSREAKHWHRDTLRVSGAGGALGADSLQRRVYTPSRQREGTKGGAAPGVCTRSLINASDVGGCESVTREGNQCQPTLWLKPTSSPVVGMVVVAAEEVIAAVDVKDQAVRP